MMRNALFLLILFVFVGCNSKEAALTSIQGLRDPNNPQPKIVSILPQGPGVYAVGSGLDFYVTYDEVVVVDGAPRLPLTLDSGTYYADYISGSGTNVLYFQFAVPAGAYDYNGIQLTGNMNLNGGSIYDPDDDDDSLLNYSIPSTSGVFVNGINPVITSVTIDNGNYKIGDSLEFTVNYSYPVFVTGTPHLPVTIGAALTQVNYTSGSGTSALKFTYPVGALQDYNGIDISVGSINLAGATITDYFGDNAGSTFSIANFPAVLVDGIAPAENARATPLDGTKFLGSLLFYTVSYSEIVNVTGLPRVQINIGGATRYANYYGGTGTANISFSYTVAYGDMDTDGIAEVTAIDLNGGSIKDRLGNPIPAVYMNWPPHAVNVDGINPTVSAVSMASGSYKIGDLIEVHATYSEPVIVTGGSPTIGINIGGVTKQAVYFSGTGTSDLVFRYTVEEGLADSDGITIVSPINFNGSLIKDSATNLASTSFTATTTAGALVDAIRPTISVSLPTGAPTVKWRPGNTMAFTFTASETVTIAGTPKIGLLVGSSTKAISMNAVGGPTTTFSFSYVPAAYDMDLNGITFVTAAVDTPGGTTIRDSFGNDAVLTFTPGLMTNIWVLPNEIKYWFDANDTMTTTSTTAATSFKSKAESIIPASGGGAAPTLNPGPNGTKFAKFNGTDNYFVLTVSDADVVITTVKTPTTTGYVWAVQGTFNPKIQFDISAANNMASGTWCLVYCEFFKPTQMLQMDVIGNWSPYSFTTNQYRTLAVDFKNPGAGLTYRIGQFNGEVGEMFVLSSGAVIPISLIEEIGNYLNSKHGASW